MRSLTTSSTRRAVALAGALAISFGAAACSKQDPAPSTPSTGSSSAAGSASVDTSSAAPTTADAEAPSADELLTKVKASTKAAKSGAFTGEVTQSGKKMGIDFVGTSDGSTADVTVEMEGEGKVRIIAVDGGVYMQADEKFWKAQGAPANVQKAGDKFIKAPGDSGDLTKNLNLSSFLDEAFGAVTSSKLSDKVGSETVNGVDCWVLVDKQGAENGALYVSKDKSELVRFTGSKSSPGSIDFSKWNETPDVKAPAASEILKLS